MSVGSVPSRRLPRFLSSSINSSICQTCRKNLLRRSYASAAAAVAEPESPVSQLPPIDASPSTQPSYTINAGVLLSRPPQITRDLDPFEKAFFFYQKRLNERLSLPFTRYFYFKRGTPDYLEWRRKLQERQTPARDIGKYAAYSKEAWNDELLVGARESEPEAIVDALFEEGEEGPTDDSKREPAEKPMPRVTEADREGDQKSLNRSLQRTLYLLVRKGDYWAFPSGGLQGKEPLREAAERLLVDAAGVNMNTWFVGHVPVGHLVGDPSKMLKPKPEKASAKKIKADEKELDENKVAETKPDETGVHAAEEKTFFIKARIMGGQADLKENKLGLSEFKWLAKEEIQKAVSPMYWRSIKNMLAER